MGRRLTAGAVLLAALLAVPALAQPAGGDIEAILQRTVATYSGRPSGYGGVQQLGRDDALVAALGGEAIGIASREPGRIPELRAALQRIAPNQAEAVLARAAGALPGHAAALTGGAATAAFAAPTGYAPAAPPVDPQAAYQAALARDLGNWLVLAVAANPAEMERSVQAALARAPGQRDAVIGPAMRAYPAFAQRIAAAAAFAGPPAAPPAAPASPTPAPVDRIVAAPAAGPAAWPPPAQTAQVVEAPLPRAGSADLVEAGTLGPGPEMAGSSEIYDPLNGPNRAILAVNDTVDFVLLRPIAWTYGKITPDPVILAFRHFYANLRSPVLLANDLLQGRLGKAGGTLGRFAVNSTVGLAGLLEVAEPLTGLKPHVADFGQTLWRYGVPAGPYLVLPLLGPSNARDAVGRGVDVLLDPLTWLLDSPVSYIVAGGQVLVTREELLQPLDDLKSSSVDYYSALRGFYYQHREVELRGGTGAGVAAQPAATQKKVDDLFDQAK